MLQNKQQPSVLIMNDASADSASKVEIASTRTMSNNSSCNDEVDVSVWRRSASIDSCQSAQELTAAVLRDMMDGSEFFNSRQTVASLPSFQPSDVQVGQMLGHGEFGEVLELTKLPSDKTKSVLPRHTDRGHLNGGDSTANEGGVVSGNETEETAVLEEPEEECFLTHAAIIKSTSQQQQSTVVRMAQECAEARYAVKRLRATVKVHLYDDAICDLTCEAMFLSRLTSHPNIITLRATVGTPGTSSFMLVLDRLTDNLQGKIHSWRLDWQHCRGKALGLWSRDRQGLQALYTERLLAAFDIARALRYLHLHKILYRDIKPENIGVNARGDMQLFDFGLAKELKPRDLAEGRSDIYHATGLTGSRRYMAPEVIRSEPYGFGVDVYSFGILLWEIMALRTPFCGYHADKHHEQVVVAARRPALVRSWPLALRDLLPRCWAPDAADRMDMVAVCRSLQKQLQLLEAGGGGDAADLHISTRSRYLSTRQTSL